MSGLRIVGAVVAGALLLGTGGAIGYAQAPSRATTRSSEIERSRTSPDAPAAFRDRARLPSCGDVVLGQGDTIPAQALECLRDGTTSGAELAVAAPTTEGDLIVTFYRTGPGIRGAEIFADGTRDRFGPKDWSRTRCPTTEVDRSGICA